MGQCSTIFCSGIFAQNNLNSYFLSISLFNNSRRNLLCPKHLIVRIGQFVFTRKIQPYLKQTQRVWFILMNQWEHLCMKYARARTHQLHVTLSITPFRSFRIKVVSIALWDNRNNLESPVWVMWEAGNIFPVIHAPFVFIIKVASNITTCQGNLWSECSVTLRVFIKVISAHDIWITYW